MKKGKSVAVGLVVCFVAVIAIVGAVTFRDNKKESEDELAKTEEKENLPSEMEEEEEPSQVTQGDKIQAEIEDPIVPDVTTQQIQRELSFSENDTLLWPVQGNVIINYSMDKTVYFSTLDQYKYNPALVISAGVGNEVIAAAEGEVVSITENAQTGTTLTVKLGDGYEAVYGQLKDVKVKAGDRVEAGELIGYLNEPTKYYSIEGCNLYFQLLEDGEPRNPMEYFDV